MDFYVFPILVLAILVGAIQRKYPFSNAKPPNQDIHGGPKSSFIQK